MFDTLRDDFNRANEGPPPSSSWTTGINGSAASGLRVVSNQLKKQSTGAFTVGSAYWNVADFGPDCELAVKFVGTAETNDFVSVCGRLVNIGSGTTDGYEVEAKRTASSHEWRLGRWDDDVLTTLGATFTQALASGDLIGLRMVGSSIEAWHKPAAGSWTQLATRTDSTYTAAGKAGLKLGDVSDQNVTADDFYAQSGISPTIAAVVAAATASSVAPPKPRPANPFAEVNLRM